MTSKSNDLNCRAGSSKIPGKIEQGFNFMVRPIKFVSAS